jgi:hypothetical protein
MKTNSLKLAHIIAYTISFLCFIALFFAGKWEADFHKLITPNPFLYDFTLQQLLLCILNSSLLCGIAQPLKNEDERVQTIKNYVRVHIFFLAMFSLTIIGLISQLTSMLLIWMAIILLYYIAIFWICIYRDPSVIYLTDEERKAKQMARNNKYKNVIHMLLMMVGSNLLMFNHHFELVPIGLFIYAYGTFFIDSIYLHLKS